ncbi:hypothetical protein AADW59_00325 [Candidatus Hodgkinia cicadicola]
MLGSLVVRPSENDSLNSRVTKTNTSYKYNGGWAKAIRNGNTIIGTIDLAQIGAWVEKLELELDSKTNIVVVRLFADKVKTHWTNISYFTKGNEIEDYIECAQRLNETPLNRVSWLQDVSVYETKITKDELYRVLSSKSLCVKLEDKKLLTIEFKTYSINELLKGRNKGSPSIGAKQLDLQQNLKYNLTHKAKQYVQNPDFKYSPEEYHNLVKHRLVNEINLPRLLNANNNVSKWKNYYN